MITLLIATRNAHKVQEIAEMLGDGFRCLTLNEFPGAPVAVEDAETFAGNAAKKVLTIAHWMKHRDIYLMADDSGLEVDVLNGAPGVHSARFAAEEAGATGNAPDLANNAKLLRLLQNVPETGRTARFRCVLALLPPDESEVLLFDGACEGKISNAPSGGGGFGYDPLFVPEGYNQSFAELGAEIKNTLSHRSRALAQLRRHFAGL